MGKRPKIVAIDGPAGSGKSSLCARACEVLGWSYVNTGALYRAVGVIARKTQTNLEDEAHVARLVDAMASRLRWDGAAQKLYYDDDDITPLLGTAEAGHDASCVAKQQKVRERLLPLQRELALRAPVGALVDGRDIGTVVFPDADLKIFLTASLEQRAKRRMKQLRGNQVDVVHSGFDHVMNDIASRDERDAARGSAPLKKANDAVVLDTSALDFEHSVEALVGLIRQAGLAS